MTITITVTSTITIILQSQAQLVTYILLLSFQIQKKFESLASCTVGGCLSGNWKRNIMIFLISYHVLIFIFVLIRLFSAGLSFETEKEERALAVLQV